MLTLAVLGIRIRIISPDPDPYPGIKNWLDSKSGSVSNDTIRIQQKPFKTENNFNFFTQILIVIYRKVIVV